MKTYTDIEQSKKLADILPIESADMFFRNDGSVKLMWEHLKGISISTPCWSLVALLEEIPDSLGELLMSKVAGIGFGVVAFLWFRYWDERGKMEELIDEE